MQRPVRETAVLGGGVLVTLTEEQIRGINEASRAILGILEPRTLDEWFAHVRDHVRPLLGADRVFAGLPVGEFRIFQSDSDMVQAGTAYHDYYCHLDIYMHDRRRELGLSAFLADQVIPQAERQRAEIWQDWIVPHRLYDPSGIAVDVDGVPVAASLNVYHERPRPEGFGDAGFAILSLLAPAFEVAVRTARGLGEVRTSMPEVVDELICGALLVSDAGEVVHVNRALGAGLSSRSTEVIVAAARELVPLATRQRNDAWTQPTAVIAVEGEHLRLFALPLTVGARSFHVVLVETQSHHSLPEAEAVAGRLGLTPRQAEVAMLLAQRWSTKEIAAQLFISPHTVRRHTEAVFLKLGVKRRRDVHEVLTGTTE